MTTAALQELVWTYATEHGRSHLPWRLHPTPYAVLVSEIMLQQTQVDRVIAKFNEFMLQFPTLETLAEAPLSSVLRVWLGLGYNRRAKYLHAAAREIVTRGAFPSTQRELMSLPGIGPNTAGAILAYSFNQPVVYIETNIRTVFLHHFFANKVDVHDKELLPLIEEALDREHPREWYGALMDYGTFLKKKGHGCNNASRHYKKQAKFQGSVREMRGGILAALAKGPLSDDELARVVVADDRFPVALKQLQNEGLITAASGRVSLAIE